VQDFIPGQRWISEAELQMGLGTVLESDFRTVTLLFLATGESRTYARESAPLTRMVFAKGDTVNSKEGWQLVVNTVEEQDGLLSYRGKRLDTEAEEVLKETNLDNLIQLNRPAERLFSGQIDKEKWFKLRYSTLQHVNRLAHSDLRGLTGCRTSLIPHQMYIAHEVANRYAPRVLLADEVGLGKTIEAGLILHHQLLTERANRVLIVVPESLVHQWLVEMIRRFNLSFSVFDEQRCLDMEESLSDEERLDPDNNPFQSEQLILCSLDFLSTNPQRFKQAYMGDWDILVVDEAHHLEWNQEQASLEYELIELLATETPGVLLLTATPEQLGKASHYARLRLLDPERFPSYESFLKEEDDYQPIADAVETLLNDETLSDAQQKNLHAHFDKQGQTLDLDEANNPKTRINWIERMLDQHGTGRVLFRNTRNAVKGFPSRQVTEYPLDTPADYAPQTADIHFQLCPELAYQGTDTWTSIDPRIDWLRQQLKQIGNDKVLLITASAETAMDIAEVLRVKSGIHAGVFHEHMSIIERDRGAAFFADMEFGCQLLICSEIGSEGRNFQFSHHLILFDLPLNPDLLEQRIGRLDRIGQLENIQIHVPYLEGTAQETMFKWYHEGLGAFEHTCPAGHNVFVQIEEELCDALAVADSNINDLIAKTARLHDELNHALHHGRDRLLEFNSCRPTIANELYQRALKQDDTAELLDYLETVYDCFGVDSEVHGQESFVIHPGEHVQSDGLPGLREEGMTYTCDRDTALPNEDMQFFTWEHPLVTGALDRVLANEQGNTSVTSLRYRGGKAGTLLMECLYTLESASSQTLQASRYLPPTTIRVVVDQEGNASNPDIPHNFINKYSERVKGKTANQIVRAYKDIMKNMLDASKQIAEQQAPSILSDAHDKTRQMLKKEIERLVSLQQVNPNVRDEEVQFFKDQWQALNETLDNAALRLDALRVIVVT